MDVIKKSFENVKKDIDLLKKELVALKDGLEKTQEQINNIQKTINYKNENSLTNQSNVTTDLTNIPTVKSIFKPLNTKNLHISSGNGGVPTDKQTNRQTDKQTQKNSFEDAIDILNSLSKVKKELRLKFKRLTEKELLVFSIIYQLEDDFGFTSYRDVADKLSLSESSIRDYVGRLIKKGIPIEKKKINNKNVRLSIPKNLRQIATLPTILNLREL